MPSACLLHNGDGMQDGGGKMRRENRALLQEAITEMEGFRGQDSRPDLTPDWLKGLDIRPSRG